MRTFQQLNWALSLSCCLLLFPALMQAQCAAGENEVTVNILTDDWAAETTWEIRDMGGVLVANGGSYATDFMLFEEDVCLTAGETYDFTIFDSADDGICCTFGAGNWDITDCDGSVLAFSPTAGDFGAFETVSFTPAVLGCTEAGGGGGGGGTGCNELTIEINTDNFGGETSWELRDGGGNLLESAAGLPSATTVTETITVPDGVDYNFTIFDSFGDGICCSYGIGSYNVSTTGGLIAAGGAFGASESTDFDLAGGTDPCPPTGCNDVTVEINTDNFGGETSWELRDSDGALFGSASGLASNTTVTETVSVPDDLGGDYTFTIFDSFGDGICCSYGIGDYSVSAGGAVVASGGAFGASEATSFTLDSGTDPCPPIPNDNCDGALPIACGSLTASSTVDANFDGAPFCEVSNTGPGVWYVFTGTGDCLTLSTDNPGTNYDTKLTVYEGSCAGLVCVDGDDDGGTGLTSELVFNAEAGTDYLVLVHGFGSAAGDFELSAVCNPGPANDDCIDAIALTHGVPALINNMCASVEPGEPNPGPGTDGASSCNSQDGWCSFELVVNNSVWYSYTPDASDCYTIGTMHMDNNGTGTDLQLAIYEGTCGSLTEVAANDDSNVDGEPFGPALIHVPLQAGTTYLIQVDGFAGAETTEDVILVSGGDGAPEMTCPAGFEVFTDQETCLGLVEQVEAVATDDCLASVSHRVREVDPITLNNIGPWLGPWTEGDLSIELLAGTYKVRWRAEDEAGNRTHCNQFVVVSEVLPCPWRQYPDGVGCEDGSSAWYDFPTETFWLSSEECHNPITDDDDSYAFVQHELCGDGSITAQVTSLDGTNNGWAGVMMRPEGNDPQAQMISLATNLSSNHRKNVRDVYGGNITSQLNSAFNRHWLRIVRVGDSFRGYASSNGTSWFLKFSHTVPMESCIEVGLILTSYVSSGSHTASFNNVVVEEAGGVFAPDNGGNALQVDNSDRSFTAYPSPTTGLTTVAMNGYMDQDGTLEVVNTFGQVLITRQLGIIEDAKENLDLSNLPGGVYTIRLLLETGEAEMIQIVKQ